jgi:RNA polymerase sigma factor (sigma-70 family)
MLGSLTEADDAVQETWLRLNDADATTIANLGGWLTTVVSRVCLDMLRGRKIRREESIGEQVNQSRLTSQQRADPESEALLADSVGVALLVVLDTLAPAERLAFVLHDIFAMPFDEVGPIIGRSSTAAKQLASRARRRVRGAPVRSEGGRARQREVVDAFLKAVGTGDLQGLLAVLDPDAVLHIDAASRVDGVVRVDAPAAEAGQARELRGASTWAAQMIALSRGLPMRFVQSAVIDGSVGVILAPRGKLVRAMVFTFCDDRITRVESIADPARLRQLEIRVL